VKLKKKKKMLHAHKVRQSLPNSYNITNNKNKNMNSSIKILLFKNFNLIYDTNTT